MGKLGWIRRAKVIGPAGAVVTAASLLLSPAAQAALGNTSLVMSNNQVGASSTTYTAIFSTGTNISTTTPVTEITVLLPTGVTGLSAAATTVQTAATCTGTFTTQTITGAVLSTGGTTIGLPISIATAGTCVKVVMTGLTNPSSTGTAYACSADSVDATLSTDLTAANLNNLVCGSGGITSTTGTLTGSLLNLVTDSAAVALNYVAQAANGVTTALNVAPVLNVTLNSAYQSFSITPTALGVEASNASQAVTVATNAQSYTLQGRVGGSTSTLTEQAPAAASIPFGFTESTGTSPGACTGSGTAFGVGGNYANVQSAIAGLTNATTTNLNYCWNVDFTKPAGLYTATITYLVVPSF